MKINELIIRPILTEKATNLAKNQTYMFEVVSTANKFQVKTVLEKLYKIKVGEIKMMIRKGKKRRVGKRMKPRKLANAKIAFVKVKEGKIDLFPQT